MQNEQENRVTPNWIISLRDNEIFVFGSNASGIHGAGAARMAMKWGAKYGLAEGLSGNTYALPTVNANITGPLPWKTVRGHVDNFFLLAKSRPDLTFLVTEVGCGLAGLTIGEVAPLFKESSTLANVYLPRNFWNRINPRNSP